jgi:hypothetical protein
MRNDATIKQITINRKFSFVLSIIIKEIISQIISLEIFIARNFIPASDLPFKYLLNITYTATLKNIANNIIIKLSQKFILQKYNYNSEMKISIPYIIYITKNSLFLQTYNLEYICLIVYRIN